MNSKLSFIQTVRGVKPQLISITRAAVLIGIRKAWDNRRSHNSQPDEPDFIASLVLSGTKIMDVGWREIFEPYGIKIAVTGIYCHQTPKVNFSGMSGTLCEIGDLLWCHIHILGNKEITRNAILYQAKKSSQQPYNIQNNESDQLYLYSNWPKFTYVSSGELNGRERHIKPAAPRRGAQYLLIDDRPPEESESGLLGIPGTYPAGSCIPQKSLIDHADLGLELVHSLELLSGNPFDEKKIASQEIGWSKVIWDLLLITAKKAFRRSKSGYFKHPRESGAPPSSMDGCFYISDRIPNMMISLLGRRNARSLTTHQSDDRKGEWFDDYGGGLSVILVETYEPEE